MSEEKACTNWALHGQYSKYLTHICGYEKLNFLSWLSGPRMANWIHPWANLINCLKPHAEKVSKAASEFGKKNWWNRLVISATGKESCVLEACLPHLCCSWFRHSNIELIVGFPWLWLVLEFSPPSAKIAAWTGQPPHRGGMGSVSTLLQVEPSHWKAKSVCLNYLFCNISQRYITGTCTEYENSNFPWRKVHCSPCWRLAPHSEKSEHVVCNLPDMT